MNAPGGKRKRITLDQKAAMIRAVESGTKKGNVARDFGVSTSTLSTILSKQESIIDAVARGVKGSAKRMRAPAFEAVERAVFKWFLDTRAVNLPVSGALLQRKARDFACIMGYDNFVASSGWLQRFKERHDIVGRAVCGESQSVDEAEATKWAKENIVRLLEKYSAEDIFNADETALFFKMLPHKTLALKGEPCHGGKQSKLRITALLCANMTGSEKLPIFVIGKSASPRCFKGKRQLPVKYVANRKAWMTREIFSKWLCEWDEKLAKANRKVCLVLDNCTAHHTAAVLQNIELLFLPANCTAKIQPLDQGVIMSLKAGYRKRVIDKLLLNMRMKRDTDVDLYAALEMLQAAWMSVTATTIANCFRHASFAAAPDASDEPSDEPTVPDGFATSDEVAASWTALRDAGVVPDSESFCDYVSADSEVVATEQLLDDDIVRAVSDRNETSDDDSVDEQETNVPTASEALDAVDVLRRYFGAHEGGEDGLNIAAAAERAIVRIRKMHQRPITDFFAAKSA